MKHVDGRAGGSCPFQSETTLTTWRERIVVLDDMVYEQAGVPERFPGAPPARPPIHGIRICLGESVRAIAILPAELPGRCPASSAPTAHASTAEDVAIRSVRPKSAPSGIPAVAAFVRLGRRVGRTRADRLAVGEGAVQVLRRSASWPARPGAAPTASRARDRGRSCKVCTTRHAVPCLARPSSEPSHFEMPAYDRMTCRPIFAATIGPADTFAPAYSGIRSAMRLEGAVWYRRSIQFRAFNRTATYGRPPITFFSHSSDRE